MSVVATIANGGSEMLTDAECQEIEILLTASYGGFETSMGARRSLELWSRMTDEQYCIASRSALRFTDSFVAAPPIMPPPEQSGFLDRKEFDRRRQRGDFIESEVKGFLSKVPADWWC